MQGRDGDIFRRAVLVPAINAAIHPAASARILDAGCGNGCVSRALASSGANVVGVDKSTKHIEIANSYGNAGGRITYQAVDLEAAGATVAGEPFDAIVACFTLQDCCTIKEPLHLFAHLLKPGGKAFIIFENDYSFNKAGEHSTTRRWIDSEKLSGRGRRQLIFWEPRSVRISRGGALGSEDDEVASGWTRSFKTVTRHWSMACYVEEGHRAGLTCQVVTEAIPLAPDHSVAVTRHLNQYGARPRFSSILFERPA
jgi:SAM-dependent methyltransferase